MLHDGFDQYSLLYEVHAVMVENAVMRILCCTIMCVVVFSLFPDGKMKGVLRVAAGITLTITLLAPVSDLKLPDLEALGEDYLRQGSAATAVGEDYAGMCRQEFIKKEIEAYILDKADVLSCELSAAVEVNAEGYPISIVLWGDVSESQRRKLEDILWKDLGIAKEDQQWNGSQIHRQFGIP